MHRMQTGILLAALFVAKASGPVIAEDKPEEGRWYQITNKPDCSFWSPETFLTEKATWSGSCGNGKAQGTGILTFDHGQFKGTLITGKFQGSGNLIYEKPPLKNKDALDKKIEDVLKENFLEYEGGFSNGVFSGVGHITVYGLIDYRGPFERGKFNGKGVLDMKTLYHYEGDFKDNKENGNGVKEYANGNHYEGEFLNGREHGHGIIIVPNWYRYEGEFKNGDKDGKGIDQFIDGTRYEGEYKKGWRHGHGVYIQKDGKRCEADWVEGRIVDFGEGVVNGKRALCYTENYYVKYMDRE